MSLSLENVSAGYAGRPVLSGLDLAEVPSGSIVALVGANGAGKSTLLRGIAGLGEAKGRIVLDGQDISELPPEMLVGRIGYLPQALPQGSSLIAYEAVMSAVRAARPDSPRAGGAAAIEQVFDTLGLRDLAMRRLRELSGGQRQMVGLAQVLVRKPRLLLLDEPTSALDLRWQLTVLETVRRMADAEGAICVIAIHDINLALRFCDRLVVLGGGGVLSSGPPATALDADVLRRAYGIEARVEACSRGFAIVLADHALSLDHHSP
ncbi:ABC transporter [Skermanella stibiiresistens SB22]|uniref:ABC transporter n=1 Tax=Skermanella stibiiresistens SB22 TaxID=1385369 RepID=W9H0F0_9PROT|nr:ABC transporter ATP-binding protein [Skermanella stibiiresistens]EWY39635.1 ABC transporter [Skermanella stibiiresistens SB22]